MAIELGKGAQCFRIIFIIANFLFLAMGVTLLGVGIWLVVVADDREEAESITGDTYVAGGALLIVAAVVTGVICAIGILGAIFLLRPLLIIYVFLVLLLVILEIAAAGLGFAYREEIEDEVEDRFNDAIEDYREPDDPDYEEDTNDAIEYIQDEFECCGARNWTDWEVNVLFCTSGPQGDCSCDPEEDDDCVQILNYRVSEEVNNSTCFGAARTLNFTTWTTGCVDDLEDSLEESAIALGVLAIVVAVIEVLGILMAIALCVCIHKSVEQTVV